MKCRLYSYGEDAEGSHRKNDDVGSVCQQLNVPEKGFKHLLVGTKRLGTSCTFPRKLL